ncbi:EAL domain-containing protein [Rhodoferax sp.]|uniref:bifunctional diguanylate cyclase/phosphodiesterase n=1 Tax=Rhodoferax sp. TaxID=50421 RepID=UPI00262DA658|nr:EAL domain-containing protein [Rhodoferax sp.]MDD2926243.1 EAL domain-containing protein [Rhodoferax sp.]
MRKTVSRFPNNVTKGAEFWRRLVVVALGVVALGTYIGLGLIGLKQSYDRELEFVHRSQDNFAKVLEEHARSSIEKIDTVLMASQLRLNAAFAGEAMDLVTINAALAKYLGLIGESQSLRVTDKNGRFIYDASGNLATATIADREYFLRSMADDSARLIISEPLFARITKNWVITLSRRINDPQGDFAGLVQAAVRADFFQDFYTSLHLGSAHSVSLMDDQLRLVARYPLAPDRLGKVIDSANLRHLVKSGQRHDVYTAVSAVDGVERLYAVRQVGDFPLYVLVGHATSDYLASWRRNVMWGVVSALVLAVVLGGWIFVWLRTYNEARRLAKGMTEAYETTMRRTIALLDSLPDPAWLSDRDQRLIAVNEAYRQLSGRDEQQILGQTVSDIWPESSAQVLLQLDAKALSSRVQQRCEATQEVAGGSLRHFEYISTPVLDDKGQLAGVAGVARDITQLHVDQERIRYLAEHDILTDLPNRALLGNRMSVALADALGTQAPLAVLFLDLDHFKFVNDTLGHEIGDQLLQQVSQRMRANLDQRDTISRQGGDEFAVLMQGFKHLSRVAIVAQRLIDTIKAPFMVEGHELMVGVSIGISAYPQDGADISTLLKNADTAMYQAKAAGGNAYRFFTPEMNARISERVVLENSLRRAIPGNEFRLHYQPQVDAASGRLVGLEALIRWQHPELGEIPPARFIPIAEESNLINTLGEWVLREACRQSRAWLDQGLPPVVMAVNLSAVQLRQQQLPEQVMAALAEAGLAPEWLELEITESAFVRDSDRIIEMLHKLHAVGVKLSVDDFGTGYSSLSYLKQLPFNRIKIDQSFVRELPHSEDDAAIIRAIIAIADSLKKEVIAEGVEQPEQRDFLLQNGCQLMQGYHFGRPMTAEKLAPLLRPGTSFLVHG